MDKAIEAACRAFVESQYTVPWETWDAETRAQLMDKMRAAIAAYEAASWQPIETAPRLFPNDAAGPRIWCWRAGWEEPVILKFKHNRRLEGATGHLVEYFGDPDEWDDYYLADPDEQPTHWRPLPPPPAAAAPQGQP